MRFSSPVNFWRRFGLFRNSSGNRTRDLSVASLAPLSFYTNTQYNVVNHSELCLTFTRGQRNLTKAASSPQSQSQGVFLRYSLCCGDSHIPQEIEEYRQETKSLQKNYVPQSRSAPETRQEAQLSLRDRASTLSVESGKMLHKCSTDCT